MLAGSRYEETVVQLDLRDTLLLFTDGATEIPGRRDGTLGPEGLRELAKAQTGGEDPAGFRLGPLEQQLLQFSNQIHLPDDLTLVRLRRMR
jgi:serine phosphatase RsbU (regulator of sigma subunit)